MKYVTLLLGARRNPELNNIKDNFNVYYQYYEKYIKETNNNLKTNNL